MLHIATTSILAATDYRISHHNSHTKQCCTGPMQERVQYSTASNFPLFSNLAFWSSQTDSHLKICWKQKFWSSQERLGIPTMPTLYNQLTCSRESQIEIGLEAPSSILYAQLSVALLKLRRSLLVEAVDYCLERLIRYSAIPEAISLSASPRLVVPDLQER